MAYGVGPESDDYDVNGNGQRLAVVVGISMHGHVKIEFNLHSKSTNVHRKSSLLESADANKCGQHHNQIEAGIAVLPGPQYKK